MTEVYLDNARAAQACALANALTDTLHGEISALGDAWGRGAVMFIGIAIFAASIEQGGFPDFVEKLRDAAREMLDANQTGTPAFTLEADQ